MQVELGLGQGGSCGFVWDNELGREGLLEVPPFKLAACPVTVCQFRRFVLSKVSQPAVRVIPMLGWPSSRSWLLSGTTSQCAPVPPSAPCWQAAKCCS